MSVRLSALGLSQGRFILKMCNLVRVYVCNDDDDDTFVKEQKPLKIVIDCAFQYVIYMIYEDIFLLVYECFGGVHCHTLCFGDMVCNKN